GPGVHHQAVRLVAEVYGQVAKEAGKPIIGVGGVTRWQDAAEFILAGATAVGVGTALFADPRVTRRISKGLRKWVARRGAGAIAELVGRMELPGTG
ncbi:MAG: dihydroorotate dehydrogenase, partial [Phycisphaerales bacterium JB038]